MPTIAVSGLGCEGCEEIAETAVGEVRGVDAASADHETGEVSYEGDAEEDDIAEAIEFAGYELVDEN